MKHTERAYMKAIDGAKLTRKEKKMLFGKKISRKQLREEINAGYLHHCPKCRHKLVTRSTGNMTAYPELWEYSYCVACGLTISGADNCTPEDLIGVAKRLIDPIYTEYWIDEKQPKTLYEAVRYVGENLADYI